MKLISSKRDRLLLVGFLSLLPSLVPPAGTGLPIGSKPAHAQGVVTVAAVAATLSSAIDQFKSAIAQAGDEMRGLGNSLQANAQNVLQDLNKILKDRMDQTITSLDAQERRLAEDAEALTRQLRKATEAVIAKTGDQARLTIAEADIAAYDTLYSLPCRDHRPRIVAAFPGDIVAGEGQPVMTLRGNYLTQGNVLVASVEGKAARIVEQLHHSIKIELPTGIIPAKLAQTRTLSVQVSGLAAVDRSLWFGVYCREKRIAQNPVAAAITVKPQITWSLTGSVRSSHLVEKNTTEPVRSFSRMGNNICNDNFDVSTQYCTATENAVRTTGTLALKSANCGSGANSPQPSGPRCVLVPGRVQGCGADRGPFNTWLGCRGRGWLNYDVTLVVTTKERTAAGSSTIEIAPSASDRSWSIQLPPAGDEPRYEYEVTVQQTQGDEVLNRWTVSGANPNAGVIKSRIAGGALAIELMD